MEFTNISQKAYVLEAKVTGGNSAKNQQFFLNLEKQHRPDAYLRMYKGILQTAFLQKTAAEIKSFLRYITIEKLFEKTFIQFSEKHTK